MKRREDSRPLRPLVALMALLRVIRTRGRDSRHGVIFMRALEGETGRRVFHRFRATAVGQRVLRDRIRLRDVLLEAEAADIYPPGSLGHAYHQFMKYGGVSVSGLLDLATTELDWVRSGDEAFVEERMRVMHDLWHVALGYDSTVLGEACLMAFRAAQHGHAGFRVMTILTMIKPLSHAPGAPVRRATAEGYRIGKTAAWLSGADWEALLPMPLDTVRRVLQLPPPTIYHRALEMNRRYFGVQRGYAMADSAAAPL